MLIPNLPEFIEEIGYYNPISQPKEIKINQERAAEWLKKGAKPSDTVKALFKSEGLYDGAEAESSEE